MLCSTPNQHAAKPGYTIQGETINILGDHEYLLTRTTVIIASNSQNNLKKTYELLSPVFSPENIYNKTVLDLGANGGLFSFQALHAGAEQVTAVDIDDEYIQILEAAKKHFGFTGLEIAKQNIIAWNCPADVVFALALIHWIYSCTATFGSLSKAVEFLANLTRYMLVVEWVEPEDSAIQFFHHVHWNPEHITEAYTRENFEAALGTYFSHFTVLGEVTPTRILYLAYRHPEVIDFSNPLPLLLAKQYVISSHKLTEPPPRWSCIYDDPENGVIIKQCSVDLARREYFFLEQFDSVYFPKALSYSTHDWYSVVTLEKIMGVNLRSAAADIVASREAFSTFVQHCLNILEALQERKIIHRDIRFENIMVRNGKPVLLDFGWAISPQLPYWTPNLLGWKEASPDGTLCDVYSMGRVLEQLNQHKYPEFDSVISLMTELEKSGRLTDLSILRYLFNFVSEKRA